MFRKQLLSSLVVAAVLGTAPLARAADLISYDGFDYPIMVTLHLAGGGTGWTSTWFDLGALPTGVTPEGLAWPGLLTSGRAASTAPFPSADFARYSRGFGPVTDSTIYVSFLFRPDAGLGTGGGLAFGTLWPNVMIVGAHMGNYMYGLVTADGIGDDSHVPVVQGQTALLVLRVHNNGTGTTTWSLFVNPTVGQPEPAFAMATMTVPYSMPQAVSIFNDGGFTTDEIRVGRTWPSVVPAEQVPCPADLNGSGGIDTLDLGTLLSSWSIPTSAPGCGGAVPCASDLNGDGFVNSLDLGILLSSWGACH